MKRDETNHDEPDDELDDQSDDDQSDDDQSDDDQSDDDQSDDDQSDNAIPRWADRSPRLHGLVTTGLGIAGVVLNVLAIRALGFYWPYVTALASGIIGIGLWSVVTNHSFLQNPRDVPRWWKPCALLAMAAGCFLGFVLTR